MAVESSPEIQLSSILKSIRNLSKTVKLAMDRQTIDTSDSIQKEHLPISSNFIQLKTLYELKKEIKAPYTDHQ